MSAWIGVVVSWLALVIAFWQLRDVRRSQKRATLHQIAVTANEVLVEARRVETRTNNLKAMYRTLFVFSGQVNSSREGLYLKAADEKLITATGLADYAKAFASDGGNLERTSIQDIHKIDTKLAQTLTQVRAIREDLESEQASVEAQCATYRENAIRNAMRR